MSYTTFESKWIGKRTDTDGIPQGAVYQCVDLVKRYMNEEFGLPLGSYGDAVKYWTNTASVILTKFDKISTTTVKMGDIVPLRPVDSLPSHAAGHIGVATGNQNATSVEILEQNGSTGGGSGTGADAIRKRYVPKTRILGVLRPRASSPSHPLAWTVGKTVRLKAKSHRVYPVGSLPPRDNLAYTLLPNKPPVRTYLDYRVLSVDRALNSIVIHTRDKGEQSCPIASDNKGTLYRDVEIK